jgi:hypothetical protein
MLANIAKIFAMRMDPAKTILDRVGYETAARVTGKHISRIYAGLILLTAAALGGSFPTLMRSKFLIMRAQKASHSTRLTSCVLPRRQHDEHQAHASQLQFDFGALAERDP